MISKEMVQTLSVSLTIRIQLRRIFQLIFKITIEQRQALYMEPNINTHTEILR